MTLILGACDNRTVWMGGDSCVSLGELRMQSPPKVVRAGGALLGCAGEGRLSNIANRCLLSYVAEKGSPPDPDTLSDRFFEDFEGERSHKEDTAQEEGRWGFDALYGLGGELYRFGSDLDYDIILGTTPRAYAIGSGGPVAVGAFAALTSTDAGSDHVEAHIRAALRIGADLLGDVRPPFYVYRTTA